MRIKTKRHGKKTYYEVIHDYVDPATGRHHQLTILTLGKHATVTEALKATNETIAWRRRFNLMTGLSQLARYRAWLRVCRKAGLS
jgi:hypothetical protein